MKSKENKLKLSLVLLILTSMLLLSSCGTVYKGQLNKIEDGKFVTNKNDTLHASPRFDAWLSRGGVWKVWHKEGKTVHIREYFSERKIKAYGGE